MKGKVDEYTVDLVRKVNSVISKWEKDDLLVYQKSEWDNIAERYVPGPKTIFVIEDIKLGKTIKKSFLMFHHYEIEKHPEVIASLLKIEDGKLIKETRNILSYKPEEKRLNNGCDGKSFYSREEIIPDDYSIWSCSIKTDFRPCWHIPHDDQVALDEINELKSKLAAEKKKIEEENRKKAELEKQASLQRQKAEKNRPKIRKQVEDELRNLLEGK